MDDILKSFVKDYWPLPGPTVDPIRMNDGLSTHVYLARINDEVFVLKMDSDPERFLKEKFIFSLPVNVRHPRFIDLINYKDCWIAVFECTPGTPLNRKERLSAKQLQQYVNLFVQVNRNKPGNIQGFGRFNGKGVSNHSSWAAYILDSMRDPIIRDEDKAMVKRAADYISDHVVYLPGNNHLLHGDLYLENIILDNNGDLFVLDWENAAVGDFLYDLAVVYPMAGKLGIINDILKRYIDAGFDMTNHKERLFIYQLHFAIISLSFLWEKSCEKQYFSLLEFFLSLASNFD